MPVRSRSPTTIAARGLDYIPGSVEWADFDPTATATAIATTDAAERLPPGALAWTFDEYLRGLRKRRRGEIDWNNYSAYEIRILGALVRLGRRADAHELLEFFLADRRPTGWNQWPEISWRDPRSPGHLGDVPHAWIGAEYVLAVLGMFAYERPERRSARHRSRDFRRVARCRRSGRRVGDLVGAAALLDAARGSPRVRIDMAPGLTMPPGGVVISAPLCARPLVSVEVDGEPLKAFGADGARLHAMACERRPALLIRPATAANLA